MASSSERLGATSLSPAKSRDTATRDGESSWFGRTFESLGSGQYRLLWFSLLMMMAAMNIQMLARSFLIWELTRSEIMVGLVGAGFAPPILLFSLFGGTIADRVDKKRLIQLGQFGTGALGLAIALSIVAGTIAPWQLIGASVVQGTLFAFLMPARQAIIPQLVEKDQLSNAVALNASGMALMTLAAPAFAGLIYSAGGPETAYFTIAGLNAGAVLLTSLLKPSSNVVTRQSEKMWKDVKEGISYARSNRTVLMLLLVALSTTVLAMPLRMLLPIQIDEVFNRDVKSLGILLAMIGLGALLGSLFIAGLKETQHRGLVLLAATVMSGLAILAAGLNSSYYIALGIMVLVGIGDSGRRSLNASLMMENADPEQRGRVMGLYMMNFGLIPLGTVPMAALGALIGIQYAFAAAGALLVLAAIAMTVLTPRVRTL